MTSHVFTCIHRKSCARLAAAMTAVAIGLTATDARAIDLFVKTAANGGNDANDGLSWANAKATISGAMASPFLSNGLDVIRVAAGTYNEKPQFPTRRRKELLGGFPAAGGSNVSDPVANPTIIEGTGLGGTARALITIPAPAIGNPTFGTSDSLVIDGFILRNGSGGYAGAIYSQSLSLQISNNIIENNTGTGAGAIFLFGTLQDYAGAPGATAIPGPRIEGNIIRNNLATATVGTGGIYLSGAFGRDGTTNNGGGFDLTFYDIDVVNNLIYGNVATAASFSRGAMWIEYAAHARIVNCTIAFNSGLSAGIFASGDSSGFRGEAYLKNCIVWHPSGDDINVGAPTGLITANFCDLNDSADLALGSSNFSASPGLVDAPGTPGVAGAGGTIGSADYQPTDCSPCVNTGTMTGAPADDLLGISRPQFGLFDIGAYELATLTDTDSDGVADCNDNCPGTPTGETVDADGCSCSQADAQAPTIMDCPTDVMLPADSGACSATAVWTPPTATDNCHLADLSSDHSPGDSFNVGTTTVTYTATDDQGNMSTCSFTVTVTDTESPTFATCLDDISMDAEIGLCSAVATWDTPDASDNCSVQNVNVDHASGEAFPVGETVVTYTASDASGNMAQCSFTVLVTDTQPPMLIDCPGDITLSTQPGANTAVANWTPPTASDNCGTPSLSASHNPGDTFPLGTTSVSYTATDAAGLTANCSFSVTVEDGESPMFSDCPANISASTDAGGCSAVVSWTPPTAMDNVSVDSMMSSHNPGDPFPIGTTTVEYTATDNAGNSSICIFTVTVTDNEAPSFTVCASNQTIPADSHCEAQVPDFTASATAADNCDPSVTVTQSPTIGTVIGLGSTSITLTATDTSGNLATCQAMLTVESNGCDSSGGDDGGSGDNGGSGDDGSGDNGSPQDIDGVDNAIEDAAPNNGDGNGDGVKDSQQDNVTSLPNLAGQYVTLVSPAGTQLAAVQFIDNPSPGDAPAGVAFPIGFLSFEVRGLKPGSTIDVQLILHGASVNAYWKYGPEPTDASPHWYDFAFDGGTGATFTDSTITLRFTDGARGDDDLAANGVVIEPGAPGVATDTSPNPGPGPGPQPQPGQDVCDNPLIAALFPIRVCGLGCGLSILGIAAGLVGMRRSRPRTRTRSESRS